MSSTGRRVKGTRNGQGKGEACASIISESVCQKFKKISNFLAVLSSKKPFGSRTPAGQLGQLPRSSILLAGFQSMERERNYNTCTRLYFLNLATDKF